MSDKVILVGFFVWMGFIVGWGAYTDMRKAEIRMECYKTVKDKSANEMVALCGVKK